MKWEPRTRVSRIAIRFNAHGPVRDLHRATRHATAAKPSRRASSWGPAHDDGHDAAAGAGRHRAARLRGHPAGAQGRVSGALRAGWRRLRADARIRSDHQAAGTRRLPRNADAPAHQRRREGVHAGLCRRHGPRQPGCQLSRCSACWSRPPTPSAIPPVAAVYESDERLRERDTAGDGRHHHRWPEGELPLPRAHRQRPGGRRWRRQPGARHCARHDPVRGREWRAGRSSC
jgi:hypothetical protein